ncbi:MAG: hypothetical protein IMW97_07340 [Firmicutes bacterium]|nr:hypothetical protein [Candidatus Fermentithermobacillaceae bacterium]
MEKAFEDNFKEYEEWRARQASTEPEPKVREKKDDAKKQPFLTKWDLLFIFLGFILAVTLGRGCGAAE